MRNILLATAALSLMAVPAMAQTVSNPQWYGTGGYTHLDAEGGDLGAITGRVGARLAPNFAVEGEGSFGVRDQDISVAGVNGKIEHQYDAAVYGVGVLPVSPNFELFGRLGYGTTKIKATAAGASASADGESFNYGLGAQYFLDTQNGLRADWTRRDFRDDGGEADTYGVSYVRRF